MKLDRTMNRLDLDAVFELFWKPEVLGQHLPANDFGKEPDTFNYLILSSLPNFISQLHMLVLFTGLFREKYFLKNILELLSKLVQSTAHVESCDNATTTVHTSLLHF